MMFSRTVPRWTVMAVAVVIGLAFAFSARGAFLPSKTVRQKVAFLKRAVRRDLHHITALKSRRTLAMHSEGPNHLTIRIRQAWAAYHWHEKLLVHYEAVLARRAVRRVAPSRGSLRAYAGCMAGLIDTEDPGWSVSATNPRSGAYGLPQALPGSKMSSAGSDWATNPYTQIRWMWGYVNGRYGGCAGAYAHEAAYGWY